MNASSRGIARGGGALCIVLRHGRSRRSGGLFDTKVTIKANGGDISGKVKSPSRRRAPTDRLVKVFRRRAATGRDERIGSDTASLRGRQVHVEHGHHRAGPGKYYAKARKTDACEGDKSEVVTVE